MSGVLPGLFCYYLDSSERHGTQAANSANYSRLFQDSPIRLNAIKGLDRRIWLVLLGIGMGYLARVILGAPQDDNLAPKRAFDRPVPASMPEVVLPLE